MSQQIVAHTDDHETIPCPHCDEELCALYPADWDTTGEACETTYYATGVSHDCQWRSQAERERDFFAFGVIDGN